jgi:hypothetical protein
MGDLIRTPYSEITKFIEILDRWGVSPEDLELFRKNSDDTQNLIARLLKMEIFLWVVIDFGLAAKRVGFTEDLFSKLTLNKEELQRILSFIRHGEPVPKSRSASVIRVNRCFLPVYPKFFRRILYPQLEKTGPMEYDVAKLRQWLHIRQTQSGVVKGRVIQGYIQETGLLKTCLNLRDLEVIKKKRLVFFRNHFGTKKVTAWKSVIENRNGELDVPILFEKDGKLLLNWQSLASDWYSNYPVFQYPE